MSKTDVAIVILSYNTLEITKKCLELLFKRTDNFYPIIIDNGSTDGTVEYLQSNAFFDGKNISHTIVLNSENLGVIGGRNQGYAIYQTLENQPEYICFLDNDQFVREGWLDQFFDFMKKGNYDVGGCEAWLMDSNFMPKINCKRVQDPFTYLSGCGLFINKRVLDSIGLFDEQFNPAYFEDPDFIFRCRKNGFKIGWNINAKIDHLPHQTLGKNKNKMQIFTNSFNKFKEKWKGVSMPSMRQPI